MGHITKAGEISIHVSLHNVVEDVYYLQEYTGILR